MEFTAMELLISVCVAFWLGMKLATAWNTIAFRKILEELGVKDSQMKDLARRNGLEVPEEEEVATALELTPVEIRIEEHEGRLYAYRLDNGLFLGQGSDRDQLIENLKHNLTNVKVIVDRDNGADLLKS
jgi:hypothetical protein